MFQRSKSSIAAWIIVSTAVSPIPRLGFCGRLFRLKSPVRNLHQNVSVSCGEVDAAPPKERGLAGDCLVRSAGQPTGQVHPALLQHRAALSIQGASHYIGIKNATDGWVVAHWSPPRHLTTFRTADPHSPGISQDRINQPWGVSFNACHRKQCSTYLLQFTCHCPWLHSACSIE